MLKEDHNHTHLIPSVENGMLCVIFLDLLRIEWTSVIEELRSNDNDTTSFLHITTHFSAQTV